MAKAHFFAKDLRNIPGYEQCFFDFIAILAGQFYRRICLSVFFVFCS
jgi:hypothetical protein